MHAYNLAPYRVTVFLEDTDATGFVYHARYLQFLERARTTALYHKGVDHAQMISEGFAFVVTHADIQYKSPAKLGDNLEITTTPIKVGLASVVLEQIITCGTKVIINAKIGLACITLSGSIKRIPLTIIDKLTN
jgi:acyl-CoA thioester hydrolase